MTVYHGIQVAMLWIFSEKGGHIIMFLSTYTFWHSYIVLSKEIVVTVPTHGANLKGEGEIILRKIRFPVIPVLPVPSLFQDTQSICWNCIILTYLHGLTTLIHYSGARLERLSICPTLAFNEWTQFVVFCLLRLCVWKPMCSETLLYQIVM